METVKTQEISKAVTQSSTKDLRTLINESARELSRALPAHMNAERLVRIALTAIRQNPELAKTTPESFLGALFVAAQMGLEPVGGRSYLIPFKNKRQVAGEWKTLNECQFVIGYRGLCELFYRHDKSVQLSWGTVHENDEFDYQYGTEEYLKHKPAMTNRGKVLGYYVVAKLNNGGRPFKYMSQEDCVEHAKKHSKTFDKNSNTFYGSSPWATNLEAMSLKTCLIQLAKLLPLSVEIQRAIEADESSREYKKGVENMLDLPTTTTWVEENPESLVGKIIVTDKTEENKSKTTGNESDGWTQKMLPESCTLGEANKKDCWIIRFFKVRTEFMTDSKELSDACVAAAKDSIYLDLLTEKRDGKMWIVEIRSTKMA